MPIRRTESKLVSSSTWRYCTLGIAEEIAEVLCPKLFAQLGEETRVNPSIVHKSRSLPRADAAVPIPRYAVRGASLAFNPRCSPRVSASQARFYTFATHFCLQDMSNVQNASLNEFGRLTGGF